MNNQELAQKLYDTKEVLTQEEYQFCIEHLPQSKEMFFHNFWNKTYLNLNVYSEVEKERIDFEKEIGL